MAQDKSRNRRHVFLILRIAVVAGGVVAAIMWLSSGDRWSELKGVFVRMDMWVFGCVFGVFCVSQVLVGLRWWLLLRTQAIYIDFLAAVRLYLLGWFYNNVMPSSIGGDLIRIWYVGKHTEKRFEAGLSVLVDRAIGLASTLIIAFFFYVVFLRSAGQKIEFAAKSGSGGVLSRYWPVTGLVVAAVLGGFLVHAGGRAMLKRVWGAACVHARLMAEKLVYAGKLYGRRPLVILATFWLTVLLQITTITGFWFLGKNLGIEAGVKYYYVFFTLVWVIGAVPVSIGGAVVVEGALVLLFVNFAVPSVSQGDAVALALCQRVIWLLASVPGAIIHLAGAHLPKEFSVDCAKPAE
ncbi:MAG: flippase-like domain-containing protein [Sedimentisphaerales bacterium]|nr:flippase-like domain-containing protein [Sedimentisphaerales bacterium]